MRANPRWRRRQSRMPGTPGMPHIMIGIPCHNCAKTLPRTAQAISLLTWPKDHMRVVLLENGSSDKSFDVVNGCAGWLEAREVKCTVDRAVFGPSIPMSHRHVGDQVARNVAICAARQHIVDRHLMPSAFQKIMWIDDDIERIQFDALSRLAEVPADIVVPLLMVGNIRRRIIYDLGSRTMDGELLSDFVTSGKAAMSWRACGNATVPLSSTNGVCMVDRKVYKRIGYLGGSPGVQDCAVLSARATEAGFSMAAHTGVIIIHMEINGMGIDAAKT